MRRRHGYGHVFRLLALGLSAALNTGIGEPKFGVLLL